MQSFSFIPLMTSEKKISEYFFFLNLTFWLPWQPIKINDLDKIHMVWRGLLQEHFCKILSKYLQYYTEINLPISTSPIISLWKLLSCHSTETTWATTIKNVISVQASVMNMYAKFQRHPPYDFWEDFWIFFSKIYPLRCHGNQSNSVIWTKFIRIVEDYSRNISVKKKI